VALSKRSQMAPKIGSPALSVIQVGNRPGSPRFQGESRLFQTGEWAFSSKVRENPNTDELNTRMDAVKATPFMLRQLPVRSSVQIVFKG
jgi:hypothetical protein